jgi:hypothetical protein
LNQVSLNALSTNPDALRCTCCRYNR